jgi:hypothetical protein
VLDNYAFDPNGSFSEDPAIDYEMAGDVPVLNVYQTLIAHNGSLAGTYPYDFVPDLATCIPGSSQCSTLYGAPLTDGWNYTFVIDPSARFYDPGTGRSFSVYPVDVLFSLARTCLFSTMPSYGSNPGWLLCQALLPQGSQTYDSGFHSPLNSTPTNILNAIVMNSTICPSIAISSGHGCITFYTGYSKQFWSYFLELVSDALGGSIMSCLWATANGAGLPGFSCGAHSNPTGFADTAWDSYAISLGPLGSDYAGNATYPVAAWATYLRWHMVGSGPYYLSNLSVGASYQLKASPAWTGTDCSWTGCIPAAFAMKTVNTVWETKASTGETALNNSQADIASVPVTDIASVLVPMIDKEKVTFSSIPSMNIFFTNFDFDFNQSGAQGILPGGYTLRAPSDLFQDLAFRQFVVHAYPYQTVQSSYNTLDGIVTQNLYGGAIPLGMGDYYPTNISWANQDPGTPPITSPLSPAYWWSQVQSETGPGAIVRSACTSIKPCIFPFATYQSSSVPDAVQDKWMGEVSTYSGGAITPVVVDLTFPQLVDDAFSPPGVNPLPMYEFGWAADYPDPTDYVDPIYLPDGSFTYGDALNESLVVSGSYASNCPDGYVWDVAAVTAACQGTAYSNMVKLLDQAAGEYVPGQRVFLYNEAEHIAQQLGIFVPDPGQQNVIVVAASWLSDSNASLNVNPAVGAEGVYTWYTVQYAPIKPAIYSFTATPTLANPNSPVTFVVRANGGNSSLSYSYSNLPGGCVSANLSILTCEPTSTGSFNVIVQVIDRLGNYAIGYTNLSVVGAVNTLSSVSVSPGSVSVPAGGSATFTATPGCNGACPTGTTYVWALNKNSLGNLNSSSSDRVRFTAGTTLGTVVLFVNATLGGITDVSQPTRITILPAVSSLSIDPGSDSLLSGAKAIFSATVGCTGGTCPGGIAYSWNVTNSLIGKLNATNGPVVSFTALNVSGTVGLFVNATLNGATMRSSPAVITVTVPGLTSVAINPSSVSVLVTKSQVFSATPTCNTACPSGIVYSWHLTDSAMGSLSPITNASVNLTAGTTIGMVGLFVNATLNGVVKESSATITISSSIPIITSVAISPTNGTPQTGGSIVFSASPSCGGGNCPLGTTYKWSLNSSLGQLNASTGHSVTFTAGSQKGAVTLFVNATLDGRTVRGIAGIIIVASPAPSPLARNYLLLWLAIAAVIAVVALVLAYVIWRTRAEAGRGKAPAAGGDSERASGAYAGTQPGVAGPEQGVAGASPPGAARSGLGVAPTGSPPPWPMVPMTMVTTSDPAQFWAMVARSGVPRDHLLVVSNEAPSLLATSFGLAGARFLRIARTEGMDHVSPADIDRLGDVIEHHLEGESNRAVVIHGIDKVIDSTSPRAVRRLVQILKEVAEASRGAVLVHLNPSVLPTGELPILEEGAVVIRL